MFRKMWKKKIRLFFLLKSSEPYCVNCLDFLVNHFLLNLFCICMNTEGKILKIPFTKPFGWKSSPVCEINWYSFCNCLYHWYRQFCILYHWGARFFSRNALLSGIFEGLVCQKMETDKSTWYVKFHIIITNIVHNLSRQHYCISY